MFKKIRLITMKFKACLFLSFLVVWAHAQALESRDTIPSRDSTGVRSAEKTISLFEKLQQDNIWEISIATNFDSLDYYKFKETYQPANFAFKNSDGTVTKMKIKVRTRGKIRKRICNYVSLKLKFKKANLVAMGLSEENKYKLVCQCEKGKNAEQLIFREYLAYRFYNIIAEDSYRTHLFKINYLDTSTGKSEIRYGFLIEDEDALAKRRGGKILERTDFIENNVSRKCLVQVCIFQYMIGNTDWSVLFLHNVKIMSTPDNKMILPVPYDFDFSGLVNAPYAVPNPDLELNEVTDRYFMKSGCSKKEIAAHLEQFRQKKEAITSEWQSFELLNNQSRRHLNRFMSKFFESIENPKKVRREFVR